MKIIVVADTHKDYKKYKAIVEKNSDADLFIHLGDGEHEYIDVKNEFPEKNFIFVQGNCDFGNYKLSEVVEAGDYKIFCTHGHEYNVQGGLDALISEAKAHDCRIALFGHTHMYRTEHTDGIYVMNPGAVDSPRGKNKPSYGVININDAGKLTMNIVAIK